MAARREEPPLDVRRPFTRADAVAAGIDPQLLRGSRFRRIFRGIYVSAEVEVSPFVRTQAALALHPPTAFASHTSAAKVYELPVPTIADEHVSVPRDKDRRKRAGIVPHVAPGGARVVERRGVRVAHPLDMFVQLASMLGLVDLVVVGDAMLKVFGKTAADLVGACAESTDRHGGAARRAASYVRDEVDSPMETRLRLLLVLAGLPEPVVNHKIRDEEGRVRRRLDLSYPELRLIVEYDGRHHVEVVEQWDADLDRREELDADGWRTIVVTAKGIYTEPARTLERVLRALQSQGCRDLPVRLGDEWRAHFPGR